MKIPISLPRRAHLASWTLTTALFLVFAISPAYAARSQTSGEMTFVAFGGTTQKAMTKAFIKPFMEKTGIKIIQDQPTNYAKIKAMVSAGRTTWDVVDAESPIVKQQCGKLFQKLDLKKLNIANIPDNLIDSSCGIPSYRTGIVVLYNVDAYKDKPAPSTWDDFFNTEKYPGKRAIGADPLYVLGPIMKAVTHSNDKVYPIDYDAVFKKLDTIKDALITWKTGAQAVQMMESGRANMILTWPGRGSEAVEQGAHYKPMWKASEFSYDVWAVPKGSLHLKEAMEFINYAIGAEPETKFAQLVAYAPTNKKSKIPPLSTVTGQFAMTFKKQEKYDVLIRDQKWWADHWDEAHDKFSAWSFQ
jgi:putative spermidine/putrescine transport system substrate-binding protein